VIVPPPVQVPRREPLQMLPRTEAPEKRVDFSALRDLANLSAQFALNRHARKGLIRAVYSKLLVTSVALIVTAALLWMWNSMECATSTFYAAMAALMISVLFGMEYAVLTGRLIVNKAGRLDWKSAGRTKPGASTSPATADPQADALPDDNAQADG
jgi:hypothetical protein